MFTRKGQTVIGMERCGGKICTCQISV